MSLKSGAKEMIDLSLQMITIIIINVKCGFLLGGIHAFIAVTQA